MKGKKACGDFQLKDRFHLEHVPMHFMQNFDIQARAVYLAIYILECSGSRSGQSVLCQSNHHRFQKSTRLISNSQQTRFMVINIAGREESPFQTQLSCQWKRFFFFKSTKIIFQEWVHKKIKYLKILLVANKIISTNGKVPSPEELRKHGASPIVTR